MAANSSVKDADLNQFLAGPGPPPGSLVPFPMSASTPNSSAGPSYQGRFQNLAHGNFPQQQNTEGALSRGPGHVSVDWVNDFRKMQLNTNQWDHTQGNTHFAGGPASAQTQPAYAPLPAYTNRFSDVYHGGPFLGGAQAQSGLQQTNLSQDSSMASSNQTRTDEILDELFAEFEQAAESAGPETKPVVSQITAEEMLRYEQLHDPVVQTQEPVDEETQHQRDLENDYQLRKAAQDIMTTLSTNQSEKFKNSTFIDLMNRIYQKEVVLQGNDLFDTTTGTVLGNTTDTPAGPEQAHQTNDSKGKGKAVETTSPTQQHAA